METEGSLPHSQVPATCPYPAQAVPEYQSRSEAFFVNDFYSEQLLAPRATPKLEDHPFSAVRDCLFNTFAATFRTGGCNSVRNLRTRHAVVTGTHLSRIAVTTVQYMSQRLHG